MARRGVGTGRVASLDVLRGMAIFGTLGTNVWIFAFVGDAASPVFSGGLAWWASVEAALVTVTLFLTNGKFLGLLTVLFGVGMALQHRSAKRRGLPWPGRYLPRAGLLFVEGALHYVLVFEFDILMGYAVAAFIVAPLVGRSERVIRWAMRISGGVHLALFGGLSALLFALTISDPAHLAGEGIFAEGAARVYAEGTWSEAVAFRVDHFLLYRLEAALIIPMNVFLFLLGVRLVRSGAFSPDPAGRRVRRRMTLWGLLLGVPLNLLIFVPGGLFELPVRYLFAPVLSLGYAGAVLLLMDAGRLPAAAARVAEVGRAALSCYVLQNVLASVVFYGWGLGLTGRVGAAGTIAIWTAICAVITTFAHLWLRKFAAGPIEGVWRALARWSYGTPKR